TDTPLFLHGYGVLIMWSSSLVSVGTDTPLFLHGYGVLVVRTVIFKISSFKLQIVRYMYAPLHSDLKLAFGVLIYLKNASGKGISFNKGDKLNLSVYVDSDWAKCKVTRKSVTGYVVFMGKNLIS
ncbi:hypothetical protein Tco_0639522, partial [Tanacetum coccineum]